MPSFRTEIKIPPSSIKINHLSNCWSIGSCFAENIGQRLQEDKFQLLLNPMGIIYNPISITQTINCILSGKHFVKDDLFEHESQWHSFLHHGSFSNTDPVTCLSRINQQIDQAKSSLQTLDVLLLTLGTAHCFKHIPTSKIVANCHRLPNQEFERIRLSPKLIIDELKTVLEQLKQAAPNAHVLLTVSPVRYLRDGLISSTRSKAALLLAVDALVKQLDFVSYFPAYELVMDDLRDYRFFDTDMAHPNQLAVDYVYDKFQQTYLLEDTVQLTKQLRQFKQAMAHRPKGVDSAQHKQFKAQQRAKLQDLLEIYPYLDMGEEMAYFEDA